MLPSPVTRLRSLLWMAVAALSLPSPSSAQYLTRPQIPWRTITTPHFDVHFPAEMEEWTRGVAARMEAYAGAVNAVVGNQPASRVTVLVEDPSNVANGFALPFMEGPVIFLWPTPPSPSPTLGAHRGWGEALAVHEYAHVAHLTFPSRNPRERLLWKFLPTRISPVARKAPAWVIEGYATVIEGQLTGSGRPFSAGRAAVLRQWALEGRFPTYGQLNGTGAFLGGNMRYLAGSAFLEWLQQRKGDSSLVHLWRRMSARQQRTFDAAFVGVFGASPAEMYGAFTVDVMDRALQVRARLRDAGLAEGELVQRMSGGTGDPAVSPDGRRVAIVARSLNGPSRLQVWDARPTPETAVLQARARLLEQDSLDVAPFDSFPRPRRVLATLRPANGRSHEHPRWVDSVTILVTRDEPAPNGITRPDLFLWNTRSGVVRRVTRGAGVRQADPSPDGRDAAAIRCHGGSCSLVMVDLRSGTWRSLAAGSPTLVWHRPRFSPDGRQVAASYQEDGRWGIAVVEVASGTVRRLGDDAGASRYAPAWTPDGTHLVVVSERGGIANLERVPVAGGEGHLLTRVTGAVLAPDVSPADSSVWFLALRSGGYDVRRLPSFDGALNVVAIRGGLLPVAPPTPATAELDASRFPIPDSRYPISDYGLGPRRWRVLPGFTFGADGTTGTLMIGNIDPIARLSIVAQGGGGTRGAWRGGSVSASLRRTRVTLEASAWHVDQQVSEQRDHFAAPSTDLRYTGGGLIARLSSEEGSLGWSLRVAATAGRVGNDYMDGAARVLASGEARGRITRSAGPVTLNVAGGVSVSAGRTGDDDWRRVVGTGTIVAGTGRGFLRADWLRGSVTAAAPGEYGIASEQFLVGGSANPWIDQAWLAQRITVPAVPPGFAQGSEVQVFRASLGGMSWEPYATWIAAGDSLTPPKRLAGVERTFAVSSLGFARLPGVRARVGAGYSLDIPYQYRTRVYGSITYSP